MVTIRLYNPSQAVLDDVASVKLPSDPPDRTRAGRGMIILAGLIAGALLFVISYRLTLHRVPIKTDGHRREAAAVDPHDRAEHVPSRPRADAQVAADRDAVARSVYSSCVYDLSAGDLVISGALPPEGHYWSLSLYAHNTDNYFVLNDRELAVAQFSIVVRAQGSAAGRAARNDPSKARRRPASR